MSAISAQNLSLSRGKNLILDKVNFDIAEGSFVGVLGTNGAGKTTLFQAVLGLIPVSGTLNVLGAPVSRGNVRIGYLPQARNLSGHIRLAVSEYLKSSWDGEKWGFSLQSKDADRAIDTALEQVGALALRNRPMNALSGGERQRVLIAQCLMRQPELLILDEPLISLDPARAADMIRLVRDIQQRLHLTVLFSAHELNPLLGSLDQVLYLGRGNAVLGSVEEVITGPVLSKLYGTKIDVVEVKGRIFVMAGDNPVEMDAHMHDHDHEHHHHA